MPRSAIRSNARSYSRRIAGFGFLTTLALVLCVEAGAAQSATSAPIQDTTGASNNRTRRPPGRRTPVTESLLRDAFVDPAAQAMLARARAGRVRQDAALNAYIAKGTLQYSWWVRGRAAEREQLVARNQQVARLQWSRATGVWAEPLGERDMHSGVEVRDFTDLLPVPHWEGREALWIPTSSDEGTEFNTRDVFHPFDVGAEADYRYASGDSIRIALEDQRVITVYELKILPRRAEWHLISGAFWIDAAGSLVRAAYRFAAPMDVWEYGMESHRDSVAEWNARADTDTGRIAQQGLKRPSLRLVDRLAYSVLQGSLRPWQINLTAVTVEYGLHEGELWLPRRQRAQRETQIGALRLRFDWQERYTYESVNRPMSMPPVPGAPATGEDTTTWAPRGMIVPADTTRLAASTLASKYAASAQRLRDSAAARPARDSIRARRQRNEAATLASFARQVMRRYDGCAVNRVYFAGTVQRYIGGVRVGLRLPCDGARLSLSSDLPASIYDTDAEFVSTEQEAMMRSLEAVEEPASTSARPMVQTGLSYIRYNRIEGLSLGASVASTLGRGYRLEADGRFGLGDHVLNGGLALAKSNGRQTQRVGVYHRLGVANDDWGAPLSVGASLTNVLFAKDEGFYFRTAGAEYVLSRAPSPALSPLSVHWRLFAERQWSAGSEPNTQGSLAGAIGSATFQQNIEARGLSALGSSLDLSHGATTAGGFRLQSRARLEGASMNPTAPGDSLTADAYGRLFVEATVSHNRGKLGGAVTVAGGTSVGELPAQRAFFVGGVQSVRGQSALPGGPGRIGDAFWMVRTEAGYGLAPLRALVFYDAGWAGQRTQWAQQGRPLSGAGVGLSLMDGLLRVDAARGIAPERRWRFNLQIGARF